MITDPIQVTVLAPPDKFLGLTSTAWAAISSFLAAITTVALLIFNWRYVHWTHKLSDSAAEQSVVARASLKKLEEQIHSDLATQRHAAIAVLREAVNHVQFWAAHFRTETRSETDAIQLIPDDWNNLVAYVSRRLPDSASLAAKASQGLRNVEGTLNRLVRTPYNQRGPNGSLGAGFDSLGTNMDNVRKLLDEISVVLAKDVIHTPSIQAP
jgi:hypothetical protein